MLRRAVGHRRIVPADSIAELRGLSGLRVGDGLRRRRQHDQLVERAGEDRHARAGDHRRRPLPEWNNHDRHARADCDRQPLRCRRRRTTSSTAARPQTGTSVLLTDEGIHTVDVLEHRQRGQRRGTEHRDGEDRQDRAVDHGDAVARPRTARAGTTPNVTVTFTCGDSLSGVASCTPPQTRHDGGRTARSSRVPRPTTPATRRRRRTTLNIDKTPPTINGSVPAANAQRLVQRAGHRRRGRAPTRSRASRRARRRTRCRPTAPSQSASGTATDIAGQHRPTRR